MADDGIPRSMFVDFMYAVVVGATIVRIDPERLYVSNIEFWGIWFLLAVFLEDFYLYHKVVVPNVSQSLTARQLIIEMLIVFTWYVAQIAFPKDPEWFFVCFAAFFLLKFLAGLGMGGNYPRLKDCFFLVPVTASVLLWRFGIAIGPSLICLFVAWIVAVTGWWWSSGPKTNHA